MTPAAIPSALRQQPLPTHLPPEAFWGADVGLIEPTSALPLTLLAPAAGALGEKSHRARGARRRHSAWIWPNGKLQDTAPDV